mgnify:CR=1 FL=1
MDINIAFLGLGTVGIGVYNVLKKNGGVIEHRDNFRFIIKKILVRNLAKKRPVDIDSTLLTDNIDDIVDDPGIRIVAEFMGGIDPVSDYAQRLLLAGKSIVTANKVLIANKWPQLEKAAKQGRAGLYYEASVCGGIPLISTLQNSMQANNITKVLGIINGTTNYILTLMTEEGMDFGKALEMAQKQGFAEPDPKNDVDGYDAQYKLSIILSLAFHSKVPVESIYREGITNISREDITYGRDFGFALKLLGIGKRDGMNIEARVHPAFIDKNHPLTSVRDSYNAVFIDGDAVGNIMLYGHGAGAEPTASSIISDLVKAAYAKEFRYSTFINEDAPPAEINFVDNWESRYYLRILVADKPGVLSKVSGIMAKYDVSVESVIQKAFGNREVPVIFVTHKTCEHSIHQSVREINELDDIIKVASIIRVEN